MRLLVKRVKTFMETHKGYRQISFCTGQMSLNRGSNMRKALDRVIKDHGLDLDNYDFAMVEGAHFYHKTEGSEWAIMFKKRAKKDDQRDRIMMYVRDPYITGYMPYIF